MAIAQKRERANEPNVPNQVSKREQCGKAIAEPKKLSFVYH